MIGQMQSAASRVVRPMVPGPPGQLFGCIRQQVKNREYLDSIFTDPQINTGSRKAAGTRRILSGYERDSLQCAQKASPKHSNINWLREDEPPDLNRPWTFSAAGAA